MASYINRDVHPVIVNSNIQDHPVIKLIQIECFKIVISKSTSASSLQFPTLRSSCLVLDADSLTPETLENCVKFCEISINPFILLCSFVSDDKIKDVITTANEMTMDLCLRVAGRGVHVVPVWKEAQGVETLLYLVAPPPDLSNAPGTEDKENDINLDDAKHELEKRRAKNGDTLKNWLRETAQGY